MNDRIRVLNVVGTRPEAIKMAPVIAELRRRDTCFQTMTCVTAQHREMLDQVLRVFDIDPEYDLNLMSDGQSVTGVMAGALSGLEAVIEEAHPHVVLAQGDTTSTLAGCLVGSLHRLKVGHIEAGLRTHDKWAPFPEEINRRLATVVADWHFAPTENARENLLREHVSDDDILVSGNTIVDALLATKDRELDETLSLFERLDASKRLIIVTAHRRESFGPIVEGIFRTIVQIVERNPDVEVVHPVHPNPNIEEPAHRILGDAPRVHLVEPLEYLSFVHLLKRAHLVLTDSGGVQEEGPSLGVPILVMRDTTERPEGVDAGVAKLVGTEPKSILSNVQSLLDDAGAHATMAKATNPYGDGRSAQRIVDFIEARCT